MTEKESEVGNLGRIADALEDHMVFLRMEREDRYALLQERRKEREDFARIADALEHIAAVLESMEGESMEGRE